MRNKASPITAKSISKLPSQRAEFCVKDGFVVGRLMANVPTITNKRASPVLFVIFSLKNKNDRQTMIAGSVLVIIPASSALVKVRPYSKKILNKNTPHNACKKMKKQSFRLIEGIPSTIISKGMSISEASKNRNSEAKKSGKD